MIHLDTHVVVWLYAGRTDLLSDAARGAIESDVCGISPMVILELRLLREIGRLTVAEDVVVQNLSGQIGLRVCDEPFAAVVSRSLGHAWTRDPFDRMITAQAALAGVPLVTKDRDIRSNFAAALW